MYTFMLSAHSTVRWLLLLTWVVTFFRSLAAWKASRAWDSTDESLAKAFSGFLHLQLILGILLLVEFSPITKAAFADMGAAMKDRTMRFFVAEHGTGMMIAFITGAIARGKSKRNPDVIARHKTWAMGLGFWFVIVVAAIPWPGLTYGRPWFRLPF